MNADEIVKALRAQANCEKFYKEHNDCSGCPMPYKENPSYQKMCVGFGEEVLPQTADLIRSLQAQLAESQRREKAAVENMTAVLKRDSDDICAYCKNRIECEGQQCEKYSSGVGDVDGNYPDWQWTCMDFDYGTCSLLEDTPCNGCFDDDYKGFEWRGPHEAGKGG